VTVSAEAWYDDDAGPLVRLYARVSSRMPAIRDDLELNTLIHHVAGGAPPDGLSPDQQAALRLTRRPVALCEIAAHLGLPVGLTRLLLGELREAGLVTVRRPTRDNQSAHLVVLERLLSGLHSL
jgi:DNA-binding transcriptional ArsR family regulator